jgi:hypothetical protein
MAVNYEYNYANIDTATGMCIGIQTTTSPIVNDPRFVEIPVYDGEYLFKYYINGSWYEDAAGTIPWTSSLL